MIKWRKMEMLAKNLRDDGWWWCFSMVLGGY